MKLLTRFQARFLVASMSAVLTTYVWAFCGNAILVGMPSQTVDSPRISAERQIRSALNTYDTRITNSLQTQEGKVLGAIAILTKQKEISADYISHNEKEASKVLVAAMNKTKEMDQIREIIENNSAYAQGHDPCRVMAEQEELVEAVAANDEDVYASVRHEITAAPGKYKERDQAIADRATVHNANYCTADQAASNLCTKEAPRAGNSLKATTLFTASAQGDRLHEDKVAFINNLVGFPAEPLTTQEASTVAGTSYIGNVHRLNAVRSPAMAALKQIQSDYTGAVVHNHFDEEGVKGGISATDKDESVSPDAGNTNEDGSINPDAIANPDKIIATTEKSQALKAELLQRNGDDSGEQEAKLQIDNLPTSLQLESQVARYLGNGEEYEKWNTSLVKQNDKGLLTEILRIKALKLWMQSREYEQQLAIESMLSATVSADLYRSGLEEQIEQSRTNAISNAIVSEISSQ